MQDLLFILVIVLAAGLFLSIGVVLWLGHRFLRLKELENKTQAGSGDKTKRQASAAAPKRAGSDILKALRSSRPGDLYCVDHPDMLAAGACAVSGEAYCEHCLADHQDVKLAKKHLDLYLNSQWEEAFMLHNAEVSQDAAERIVKVKSSLWKEMGMPLIVQGHYKINIQSDEIESYTVVIARKDDLARVKKELSFL